VPYALYLTGTFSNKNYFDLIFQYFIAKRYLIAKKSQQAINIITLISIIGVMVGTAGLVIVLSVFNGFGNLMVSLYDTFDADIKITATTGKTISVTDSTLTEIQHIEGVAHVFAVYEENVLFKYGDKQVIGKLKGIPLQYADAALQKTIIDGSFAADAYQHFAVFGAGIAYQLGMDLDHVTQPIQMYVPKTGIDNPVNVDDAFNQASALPTGVFSLQQDFDNQYVFVPLTFAQTLFDAPQKATAIEVTLKPNAPTKLVQQALENKNWQVQTRQQQHAFLYAIINSEKFIAYFILVLILIISTFNILGSLTMLIIEKQKDLKLFLSMGATPKKIKQVFVIQGLMITAVGSMGGLLLGFIVCFCQQHFGIIKIANSQSFVVDAYPVAIVAADFIICMLIVTCIGAIASFYTAHFVVSKYIRS